MTAEPRPPTQPFADPPLHASPHRQQITANTRLPESRAIAALLTDARLSVTEQQSVRDLAAHLITKLRDSADDGASGRSQLVQGLLQEYSLSSQEGIALMCLAEALLRIPDDATRDALIRDKIAQGRWQSHLGQSPSLFVNAATWGLLLTGRLVATHSESGLGGGLSRLIARSGEPVIRRGVDLAMRMMGEHFVSGRDIDEALVRASPREGRGYRHSFDMLGEAALTAADASRYRADYETAIHAIGRAAAGRGFIDGPGISIKLSALHPRYARSQQRRVVEELLPSLIQLATLACRYDIGLNIDAEEADRLELSLDLLESLCFEPALAGWNGLGFVVQAYQKRCPAVIDHLIDLASRSGRRLMVRLVKGAYWDSEIKRAQIDGLDDYPVYTRKVHTDVAYVACARRLLAAPQAIYPQFATHNARTLATIHTLADPTRWAPDQYEFQCLHGMGEPLYDQVVGLAEVGGLGRPCRIYAPVGTHETLLAYLVRRLLENGANSSFVNQVADADIPLGALVRDPVDTVDETAREEGGVGFSHPAIPLPRARHAPARSDARGLDLTDERDLRQMAVALTAASTKTAQAMPPTATPVRNPADRRDIIGHIREADQPDLVVAVDRAVNAAGLWAAIAPAQRAACLQRAADTFEASLAMLSAQLIREAGKTAANAVAEVREAIDFLRYYAAEVTVSFDNATHLPLGPVACISPWNFPLAIFVGQIGAALAAGNTVIAKPAEQTPLIAATAVRVLHEAGVPQDALQLLPGPGETIGAALVADPRIRGVLFTGSTAVARHLQRTLASRDSTRPSPDGGERSPTIPAPLIAETGGQNAMIVDSSALPEQVVADVLSSAFDSAGQRCSALRLLCVQAEAAPRVLELLVGAMSELQIGRPDRLATDVGPVIDEEARDTIEAHVRTMRSLGHRITRPAAQIASALGEGSYVAPTLIEISSLQDLGPEVFGPVLHVLRYHRDRLGTLLDELTASGYGLTMGLHTRIDETISAVSRAARVGNLYVNRNMVGAVVGVQPFGGEGLSGTGPKAGGPLYLYRLLSERPDAAPAQSVLSQGQTATAAVPARAGADGRQPGATLAGLATWAAETGRPLIAELATRLRTEPSLPSDQELPGPTGERNLYELRARRSILCLARSEQNLLSQLAAVMAVGGAALWPASATALRDTLPAALHPSVQMARHEDPLAEAVDLVLHDGEPTDLARVRQALAARSGPVINVVIGGAGGRPPPLEQLLIERVISINTAAAGGNASLMSLK